MFSESFLKITTKNKKHRLIQTDNNEAYLTVSNFKNPDDGLWVHGVQIFNSFLPGEIETSVEGKVATPSLIQLNYTKRYTANFTLLKHNEGLLIKLVDKNIFSLDVIIHKINFIIHTNFSIIESNINNIILEYKPEDADDNGKATLYCSLSTDYNNDITNVSKTDFGINFNTGSTKKNIKEVEIYINYSTDYEELKEYIEKNVYNLQNIKSKHQKKVYASFKYADFQTDHKEYNKALAWAIISSNAFIMNRNALKGIWAGLPWFDNFWGRDTFISLPGTCLVTGKYEEAKQIIKTFAHYQCNDQSSDNFGKVPNLINKDDQISYNTADATPLFIREIYEYYLYTHDTELLIELWPNIQKAIENVYLKNKDDKNLYPHNDADDWMDARKDGDRAYSPRGPYAIEIQALWYTALFCAAKIARAIFKTIERTQDDTSQPHDELKQHGTTYKKEALALKQSIKQSFISSEAPYIIDSLDSTAIPSEYIRPNSLLAVYYTYLPGIKPLFNDETIFNTLKYLMPRLIYEHGVSTLDKNHRSFHPVHTHEKYHKDAAYHNGMIWPWLSGSFINTACKLFMKNTAFIQTENLIAQILHNDTPGTLSELFNPLLSQEKKPIISGAYSQAWSVAEFVRSFFQDYLGIRQNLPNRLIYITPNIPGKLNIIESNIRVGTNETIYLYIRLNKKTGVVSYIEIRGMTIKSPLNIKIKLKIGTKQEKSIKKTIYYQFSCRLKKTNDLIRITIDSADAIPARIKEISSLQDAQLLSVSRKYKKVKFARDDELLFCSPITKNTLDTYPTIKEKDFQEKIIKK